MIKSSIILAFFAFFICISDAALQSVDEDCSTLMAFTVDKYLGNVNPDVACQTEGRKYTASENWIAFAAGFKQKFFLQGRSFPTCVMNGNRKIHFDKIYQVYFLDNYLVNSLNGSVLDYQSNTLYRTGFTKAISFTYASTCQDWTEHYESSLARGIQSTANFPEGEYQSGCYDATHYLCVNFVKNEK